MREKLQLPRVGERVRSKRHGTIWKIIEEKEVWVDGEEGLRGERELIPAIYLRYWRPKPAEEPGTGKTMEYRYSVMDNSFHAHWEIIYS